LKAALYHHYYVMMREAAFDTEEWGWCLSWWAHD